jgi:hypothetical protein
VKRRKIFKSLVLVSTFIVAFLLFALGVFGGTNRLLFIGTFLAFAFTTFVSDNIHWLVPNSVDRPDAEETIEETSKWSSAILWPAIPLIIGVLYFLDNNVKFPVAFVLGGFGGFALIRSVEVIIRKGWMGRGTNSQTKKRRAKK